MKKQFYENLCIKNFTNNITENEKEILNKWLNTSNKNKLLYEELKNIWFAAEPKDVIQNINLEEEWINLKDNISNKAETNVNVKPSFIDYIASIFAPKLRPIWTIGLVVLLAISSILLFRNSETEKVLKTISTQNGQRLVVHLSDGSIVNLNNDSKIQFDENFTGDKREIKLTGEAFFSVKKDGRPFIIYTNNAITKVVGTKFNVWSRDEETRVIVKQGKVSLAENIDTTKKVYLTKNELSKIVKKNAPTKPSKVDADFLLGWLNGKLVFESTPLSEIVKDLERYYNVKVNLANNDISRLRLTGAFDNEKIDSVLTKICLALNLNYTKNNENYSINY